MHQLPRTTRAPLALHAAARTHRVLCWPSWASGTGKGTCEEPRGLRCFVGQFRPVPFGGTGPRPRSQWRPCLGLFMRTSIHHNHTSHQSTIHINPSQSLVVERAPKSHDSQTSATGRPVAALRSVSAPSNTARKETVGGWRHAAPSFPPIGTGRKRKKSKECVC